MRLLLCLLAAMSAIASEHTVTEVITIKPAWATALGTDAYGTWASLTVGSQVQVMRRIPAGTFLMGIADGPRDETPVHEVTISTGFWLGESEVPRGFFQQLESGSPLVALTDDHRLPITLPMTEVTWEAGQAWCKKMNTRVPGLHAGMPTEAQWEYACRAGSTGEQADTLADSAWFAANAGGQTHPVKTRKANAWGLFDMRGNVWEWCADFKGDYAATAQTDPTGPTTGAYRVSRGGSWSDAAEFCSVGLRGWDMQDVRGAIVGMRLVAP